MARSRAELAVLSEIGRRVRSARESRGWSQKKLAKAAGMHRTYIGGVERGERNIALLNLNRIAVALGQGFDGFLPCRGGERRR